MRRGLIFLLFAGFSLAGELLEDGKLLTGVEIGQKAEPLPLLIGIEGSGCTVYAVAVPGDAKRVWIKPERLYCGDGVKEVEGFVTDGDGVLGLKCVSIPCFLSRGTQVKVFLEKKNKRLSSVDVGNGRKDGVDLERNKNCISNVLSYLYVLKTYACIKRGRCVSGV